MAWDSSTRDSAPANGTHNGLSTSAVTQPKSSHCTDPALQPFLSADFDAAAYLNATLSPLGNTTAPEVSLAELSTQTQTLLSQLSAHTTRLTNTLTQLTDEILRSGSRLAYEVEVLRGETLGLSEVFTEGLHDDIEIFVPGGLGQQINRRRSRTSNADRRRSSAAVEPRLESEVPPQDDPEYIKRLRTLTRVRSRLDTVIKTFGDAMSWTFPPSEVSVTSSFISVSAPEPGSEAHSIEEKGQQMSKQLRTEIADLLLGEDPIVAIENAAKRVEELKELAAVWKGTAEEKARFKFVESLAKLVEEKHKDLLREAGGVMPSRTEETQEVVGQKAPNSYGFMSQLQKMRGGL